MAKIFVKKDGTTGCSVTWINKLVAIGELKEVYIDGVRFIIVN